MIFDTRKNAFLSMLIKKIYCQYYFCGMHKKVLQNITVFLMSMLFILYCHLTSYILGLNIVCNNYCHLHHAMRKTFQECSRNISMSLYVRAGMIIY
jgi:hypothetical protein